MQIPYSQFHSTEWTQLRVNRTQGGIFRGRAMDGVNDSSACCHCWRALKWRTLKGSHTLKGSPFHLSLSPSHGSFPKAGIVGLPSLFNGTMRRREQSPFKVPLNPLRDRRSFWQEGHIISGRVNNAHGPAWTPTGQRFIVVWRLSAGWIGSPLCF